MKLINALFGRGMSGLYDLDDRRLSDLGLNRYDLFDAKRSGNAAGLLANRRDERAASWLR